MWLGGVAQWLGSLITSGPEASTIVGSLRVIGKSHVNKYAAGCEYLHGML